MTGVGDEEAASLWTTERNLGRAVKAKLKTLQ